MADGTWTTAEINGKPADLFEPTTPNEHGHVVLHLHGHGLTTLKDNPVWSAELERHGLRCVCPLGRRSWWLDRVCAEFDESLTPMAHLLDNVLPFIAERWGTAPPGIGLTGISMGGQGVLQLAYRNGREFPVVAAIAPAIDFQNWHGRGLPLDEMFPDAESARQETAILQLHPLNWPRHQLLLCDPADTEWFESFERLASKLFSSGIPFESETETSNGGHTWDYFDAVAPQVLGFVAERLEQESRRLV